MTARARLAGFHRDGSPSYGFIQQKGIVDLGARFARRWPSLREVIADGQIPSLIDKALGMDVDVPGEEISFALPIPAPEKIICVGVNYPDRNAEYKDGQQAPSNPSLFPRFARSFVGHKSPLVRPRASSQLDYEGEIAIVIGKPGRHIGEGIALEHVAALTLCNEGTLRDWVRHAKFNVTQGKNFDRSGAIGPWIVPFEDESQISDIALITRVNGEVRQHDRTSRLIFNIPKLIAYISTFTTLIPGDIIVTGTPTGAGARLEPPVWLKPGDLVEVEADGIGVLQNGVVDEPKAP